METLATAITVAIWIWLASAGIAAFAILAGVVWAVRLWLQGENPLLGLRSVRERGSRPWMRQP